ncbi:hypothetical protein CDD81_1121 [Ophiocordyceps australis]|uniref:Major facilitator superfamily (MFS) profile domain-containing protein n=1 Tax=Ophiocordyceps australis TaxID=1399860 RepID=A0A2C5Y1J9_9HYPO|nr:hypothetical protein CDD81_1121 [Ophiocordyceps australis]
MAKSEAVGVGTGDGPPPSPHPAVDGLSDLEGATLPPWRFWLLSVGVCLGLFLSMIDSSIVATSLYTIGAELHASESVNWVALAYTLAYLGCAVTFARLSDVIGRRNTFVTAYVVFFAFSLACGFAQNLGQLITFRALQGIGGSGLYSLSMIILPELCPAQLRQFIGSIIGLVIAGSGVLGPVLGGILTQYGSWRWVFWINGPIGFVSLVIFLTTWPKAEHLPNIDRRSWKDFDYLGSLLVVGASVLVVFAFQNAGEAGETVWGQAIFIGPLVGGAVGWVALIAWELAVEQRFCQSISPAFPISLFRNRAYAAGAASTLFLGYPYLLLIYSFPLREQVVSGKSALTAGLMLLPMLGTSALGSAISGKINTGKNLLCETLVAGACLMALGCGLLATVSGTGADARALGFLTFAGLGFGLSTAAATILVTVEAPIGDHAPAQGILAQLRVLGGSLGISTSTVLVNAESMRRLQGVVTINGRVGHSEAVHTAYSEAFRKGMLAAAAVSTMGVVLAVAGYRSPRPGLRREQRSLTKATNETSRAMIQEIHDQV